jgi:hypothetical protein
MLSTKRNPAPLPDPDAFEIPRLADDIEFDLAQRELSSTEQGLVEAERRHAAASDQDEERKAFREVEALRRGLTAAGERLSEITNARSCWA